LRSTRFAPDEIENKYASLSEVELKGWKSDYERIRGRYRRMTATSNFAKSAKHPEAEAISQGVPL
jgi:hypothetical protein